MIKSKINIGIVKAFPTLATPTVIFLLMLSIIHTANILIESMVYIFILECLLCIIFLQKENNKMTEGLNRYWTKFHHVTNQLLQLFDNSWHKLQGASWKTWDGIWEESKRKAVLGQAGSSLSLRNYLTHLSRVRFHYWSKWTSIIAICERGVLRENWLGPAFVQRYACLAKRGKLMETIRPYMPIHMF